MEFLLAPMEGLTYSLFRKIHHSMFPGTTYYSPFIAPDSTGSFKPKYLRELTEDTSTGLRLVPQLLANNAEAFNTVAAKLKDLGFDEVNLNLGCPSGTVFSKHKGAAMLRDLPSLDAFLDKIYAGCPLPVSIKTRMGVRSTAEFPAILEVFNRYPVKQLIIHARDREGQYKSTPDLPGFVSAFSSCRCPAVYNGNIFSAADLASVQSAVPELDCVMVGRGVLENPALIRMLSGGEALTLGELWEYHDTLLDAYLSRLSPNFAMDRMKAIWYYMHFLFPDSARQIKTMMKASRLEDYRAAAEVLFTSCRFDPFAPFEG